MMTALLVDAWVNVPSEMVVQLPVPPPVVPVPPPVVPVPPPVDDAARSALRHGEDSVANASLAHEVYCWYAAFSLPVVHGTLAVQVPMPASVA